MTRPGFSFLVCPDAELLKRRMQALAAEADPQGRFQRRVFWGDEGLTPAFWEALTLQSLLGTPRMLVVRNAHTLPVQAWRDLSPQLARFHDQAWPVFCLEAEFDRGKPKIPAALEKQKFWALARDKKWIWQSAGLSDRELRSMVADWAKSLHLTLAPDALQAIVRALPLDASSVARELAKLELALEPGQAIGPKLAELISFSPDMEIFAFIDSLERGNIPSEAWRKTLSLAGADQFFPFQAMVLREARILWQLLFQDGSVRLPREVHSFKANLARRLGPERLARIWDLAWEAEAGIKTGERNPEQALEMLVAGLMRTFSPGAGRP